MTQTQMQLSVLQGFSSGQCSLEVEESSSHDAVAIRIWKSFDDYHISLKRYKSKFPDANYWRRWGQPDPPCRRCMGNMERYPCVVRTDLVARPSVFYTELGY